MKWTVFVFVSALWLVGSGCHSVDTTVHHPDPGPTGYHYFKGLAVQRYVYPQPLVYRATIEALTDMNFSTVDDKTKDDDPLHEIVLEGKLLDGRCVKVRVEPKGELTNLSFHVLPWGDEPLSRIFFDRVSSRLATLPEAIPDRFSSRAFSDSVLHRGQDIRGYRGAPLR